MCIRDSYSSYETQSFITKMNDLGANALYDGMTIHPYSGTPQGSSDEAWYDDAMLKAENTGIARVQSYVNMLPCLLYTSHRDQRYSCLYGLRRQSSKKEQRPL